MSMIAVVVAAQGTEDASPPIVEAGKKWAASQRTAADSVASGEVEVVVTVGTDGVESEASGEIEIRATINADGHVPAAEVVVFGMLSPRATITEGITWGEVKRLQTQQSDR